MCGVAGVMSLTGHPIKISELSSITNRLLHRGPDGHETFIDGSAIVGLSHTRLAIVDLQPRSSQPMLSSCGRFVISYNGEIYNYIEVKEELKKLGVVFRTEGDTEVLLEGFARFGIAIFNRLNGMWAALIWDNETKTLTAIRDRFGVKPLYYYLTKDFVYFSSETRGFHGLNLKPHLSEQNISIAVGDPYYLEGAGETIYNNVFSLKAGEVGKFTIGKTVIEPWWHLSNSSFGVAPTYSERCEQFEDLFLDACRLRMRSDVPLATALSGGLDSTCVLGACLEFQRNGAIYGAEGKVQAAFSIGLPGSTEDESMFAIAAAKHLGIKTEIVEIDPYRAFEKIEDDVSYSDYIYISPDITSLLYREMRRHGIKVSLDGHGADELFIGYQDCINLLENFDPEAPPEKKVFYEGAVPSSLHIAARKSLNKLFRLSKRLTGLPARPLPWIYNVSRRSAEVFPGTLAQSNLLFEVYRHRLPSILRNFDKSAMRYGVEVRAPFLDYRIAEFAFLVPTSDKLGHSLGKRIVRETLDRFVSKETRARTRKIGINNPLELTLRMHSSMVLDWMGSRRFLMSDIWDGRLIREQFEKSIKKNESINGFRVWPILNAYLLGA